MLKDAIGFINSSGRHLDAAKWAASKITDKKHPLKYDTNSSGKKSWAAETETWRTNNDSQLILGRLWSEENARYYSGFMAYKDKREIFKMRLEMASVIVHEYAHSQRGDEYSAYASEINFLTGLFSHMKGQGESRWKLDAIKNIYDNRLSNADPDWPGGARQLSRKEWNRLNQPSSRFWRH